MFYKSSYKKVTFKKWSKLFIF